jgi:hypothetical protein
VGGREVVVAPAPQLVLGAPPDAVEHPPIIDTQSSSGEPTSLVAAPAGEAGPSGVQAPTMFVYDENVNSGVRLVNSV